VTVAAKMLRIELLNMSAELERGLSEFVLDCTACGTEVHWVQGISMSPWSLGAPLPSAARGSPQSERRHRPCRVTRDGYPPEARWRGFQHSSGL
jgi:hypothetical protein